MNLKESKEGFIGELGGGKWKGKMMEFYYLKNKSTKKSCCQFFAVGIKPISHIGVVWSLITW